jgi:hypothetical protein
VLLLETGNVTIEGPDLSGKTTLYNEIHRETGFQWNIQDRSTLSMLVYARLYNRDVPKWRRKLRSELSNLNNRLILLRPSWNTVVQRYHHRGDEIQDRDSLERVYKLFQEEGDNILSLPTVIVPNLSGASSEEITHECCDSLRRLENVTPHRLGELVRDFVECSSSDEVSPIQFTVSDQWPFHLADRGIMSDPEEADYYDKIMVGVLDNIDRELRGENEYNKPQDLTTRRFIFTQDSCISLIHTMFRNSILNVHAVCRSSDVVNTFTSDVRYLHYLSTVIHKKLNLEETVPMHLHVRMHSAHVVER